MSMIQTTLVSLARRGETNVGGAERGLSAYLGWKMISRGLRRRSGLGLVLAGGGALLLRRALKGHSAVYERMGVVLDDSRREGGLARPVRFGATTIVRRPREEVMAFFRDPEDLARTLGEIEIERGASDDAPSTWTAVLPGGRRVSSRVRIRPDEAGDGLAWETAPSSGLRHDGTLRFVERDGGRETIVVLDARWHAPAVALAAGAGLWARTALRRIRARLESGEVPVARPVSARVARTRKPRRIAGGGREAQHELVPEPRPDPVEEAGVESFPASDPPAWTSGNAGTPQRSIRGEESR